MMIGIAACMTISESFSWDGPLRMPPKASRDASRNCQLSLLRFACTNDSTGCAQSTRGRGRGSKGGEKEGRGRKKGRGRREKGATADP